MYWLAVIALNVWWLFRAAVVGILVFTLLTHVCHAQLSGGVGGFPGPGTAHSAAGPTFTFAGSAGGNPAATAFTSTTIDIGAATADRFVIVGAVDQNSLALTSLTVNGVSLAQDCNDTGGGRLWSGLVGATGGAGVATIVSTYTGAAFTDRAHFVYVGRGMSNTAGASTTGTQSAGGTSYSISVTAGDLLVGINKFTVTYGTSTVAPTASNTLTYGGAGNSSSPWWNTIASTNASFSVGFSSSTRGCGATYH